MDHSFKCCYYLSLLRGLHSLLILNCKMLNSSNRAVLHVEHSLMFRAVAYMKGILNETGLDNEERRFEEDAVMETCKLIYQWRVTRWLCSNLRCVIRTSDRITYNRTYQFVSYTFMSHIKSFYFYVTLTYFMLSSDLVSWSVSLILAAFIWLSYITSI